MDSTMKPGDLVKVTNRSKSDWKHNPPIVVSQFGILIEEVFVEQRILRPWTNVETKIVPGWIISTTEEGLVRRATSKIFKVKDPVDALPDLIAARNLLDKKINEIQGVNQRNPVTSAAGTTQRRCRPASMELRSSWSLKSEMEEPTSSLTESP